MVSAAGRAARVFAGRGLDPDARGPARQGRDAVRGRRGDAHRPHRFGRRRRGDCGLRCRRARCRSLRRLAAPGGIQSEQGGNRDGMREAQERLSRGVGDGTSRRRSRHCAMSITRELFQALSSVGPRIRQGLPRPGVTFTGKFPAAATKFFGSAPSDATGPWPGCGRFEPAPRFRALSPRVAAPRNNTQAPATGAAIGMRVAFSAG
jgi:hypothetical protein